MEQFEIKPIVPIKAAGYDISYTNYRSYKDEMLLTEEVKDYIKKKGLYR